MKNSNEQTLKEVIDEIIKTYKLEEGIAESKVVTSWGKIAGTLIFKHTEKIFVRKGKLFLKLDSPALKQELSFEKTTLIKKINKTIKQNLVSDIVFL